MKKTTFILILALICLLAGIGGFVFGIKDYGFLIFMSLVFTVCSFELN